MSLYKVIVPKRLLQVGTIMIMTLWGRNYWYGLLKFETDVNWCYWVEQKRDGQEQGLDMVRVQSWPVILYGFFNNFGWTNVDRFFGVIQDQKTTCWAEVPEGLTMRNCAFWYPVLINGWSRLTCEHWNAYDPETGIIFWASGIIPIGV